MGANNIQSNQVKELPGYYILPLSNVSEADYVDYISLWKRPAGLSNIFNALTGSSAFLLRQALGKYTCEDSFAETEEGVYSHIILKMSTASYQQLLLSQKLDSLAKNLAEVQRHDMGEKLLQGRDVRYMILPDDNIEPGKAEFLFGDMIFVPEDNDNLIYSVEYGLCSQNFENMPLEWYFPGSPKPVPVGLYENQTKGICFGAPGSPFILSNDILEGQPYSQIRIIPDRGNFDRLLVFRDLELVDTIDMKNKATGELILPKNYHGLAPEEETDFPVMIRFKRENLSSVIEETDANDQNRELKVANSDISDNDRTFIRGSKDNYQPDLDLTCRHGSSNKAKLKLEGFLLPRLDKLPLEQNRKKLSSWVLWLDDKGAPYNKKPNFDPELTISANNKEDSLFLRQGQNDTLTRLNNGFHGGNIQIIDPPADLKDEFLGILEIPIQTTAASIQQDKSIICGRSPEVDFSLNKLNLENSLQYDTGELDSNWDRMLTSSEHAHFKILDTGDLEVSQLSRSIPIYILNNSMELKEVLPRIKNDIPGNSATITDGEKVIIGSYLLNFVGNKMNLQIEPGAQAIKTSSFQPNSIIGINQGPLFRGLSELLYNYLEFHNFQSGVKQGEIGPISHGIIQLIDQMTGGNNKPWQDIINACHDVRVARNRWAHASLDANNDSILENILCLIRTFKIFKEQLFNADFSKTNRKLISEFEHKLKEARKTI